VLYLHAAVPWRSPKQCCLNSTPRWLSLWIAGCFARSHSPLSLPQEFGNLPESVAVDKVGDIFVGVRGVKKFRRIDGKALQKVVAKPAQPEPPYVVGMTSKSVTMGWTCNDEGTGLIDQYIVEYQEVFKHEAKWKTLVVKEWAHEDDLLHEYEGLPPNSSYMFRVKSRNRLGTFTHLNP
jgi:hypothetical protein